MTDEPSIPGLHQVLSPGLLVASPQMADPFFAKTVVLLCRHEDDGAMGIVINRETDLELQTVLTEVAFDLGDAKERSVMWGGPVEPHRGT
ncbi:MAG: YqgE/AlgH family protein, partial [Myxococcota bacterium]|nr:YqgE/AlgH family protein [Myxococcota bacterium]